MRGSNRCVNRQSDQKFGDLHDEDMEQIADILDAG
jgi:hypothetical protein